MASHFFPRAGSTDYLEYLFQSLDLAFGFSLVLLESSFEVWRLRSLRHVRQRRKNLFISIVDVLERIEKQFGQIAWLSWPFRPPIQVR
jgi:hypothetical protein